MLVVTAEVTDNGILGYQWFGNDIAGNTGGTAISGATDAFFIPDTDIAGIHYYYVLVTNTNTGVNGTQTAVIASAAVPVTVVTAPDAPINLTTVVDGNKVTLSWEAPENNGGSEITGYQVSDNVVDFWIPANGENEHTFEGLNFGSEYTFNVRAVNFAGAGEMASLTAETPEKEIEDTEEDAKEEDKEYKYYEAEENNNLLLWIGLGTLAPLGTGTGIYLWKRKR